MDSYKVLNFLTYCHGINLRTKLDQSSFLLTSIRLIYICQNIIKQ